LLYVTRVGPHVEAASDAITPHQPELAGQQHLTTAASNRPADQLLILVEHRRARVDACVPLGLAEPEVEDPASAATDVENGQTMPTAELGHGCPYGVGEIGEIGLAASCSLASAS
jgi:hypothetical protein